MNQISGQVPSFSVVDLLRGFAQRKLLIGTSVLLGLLVGLAIMVVVKPTYLAESRVLIDNQSTPYDSPSVAQPQTRENNIDDRLVNSQVAVLQSQDLALRVVQSLGLAGKPEFDPLAAGLGAVKQIKIGLGFADDPRTMTEEQRAVHALEEALTIYAIPESNVIGIKFKGASGRTSADVVNALAQTYVTSTREESSGGTERAREWLSTQIDALRDKVSKSDAAVEKFRASAGLLKGTASTLNTQQISELNSQITLAEAARTEAEARADEIKNLLATRGSVDSSSEVLNSPTIQRLREQQVAVERKLADLSATYLPNHPKMQAAQRELSNIQRQVRVEALRVVEGLQGQAKIAAARSESLRNSLEAMKGKEGNSLQDDVKLQALEREAKANRDQLETMLARYADTNTRQDLSLLPGLARIIQTADAPANPAFPKFGPVMLLCTLAGLGFGLGIAFLLEMMAQASEMNAAVFGGQAPHNGEHYHPLLSQHDADMHIPELDIPKDIARRPQPAMDLGISAAQAAMAAAAVRQPGPGFVPSLANVPQARTATEARLLLRETATAGNPLASIVENLAASTQKMLASVPQKACAITGIGGSCEVAAISLAMARHLASSGAKTIAIDLDPNRGLLTDLMELPYAPGLAELASGTADFTQTIQRDNASPLQVLRYGQFNPQSAEILKQRMEAITTTLCGIYDVVLVVLGDASPVSLALMKGCSGAVLFTPAARKRDAQAAAATLLSAGISGVRFVTVGAPVQAAA